MSVINSSKTQLMLNLKKQFPRLQIVSDMADVLLAGQMLMAIDEFHKQKKWAFLRKGAKDNAFYSAYKKYGLLEKKEKERKVYFEYKRPNSIHLNSNQAILKALRIERIGLYKHMLIDPRVRNAIVTVLKLPSRDLNIIKKALERDDVYKQLGTYGKIINFLISKKLYDVRYDYYLIGFRNVPHHYWLSELALKLLSDSKNNI